ncbi:DUF2726 domain-containing protein [Deinococcus sp. QL22]|uniref:DUF2726 domain-containing protein n=1 Tax=Deinococcus sp. QL22 TaxID=2939437 RepID=UPI0020171878|nr:DUF2726 domain-containing protein [Deinococcus sp. QL22]UQN06954.1 DUF2726 domain-containing protein [Deinococcus sp. QL22]
MSERGGHAGRHMELLMTLFVVGAVLVLAVILAPRAKRTQSPTSAGSARRSGPISSGQLPEGQVRFSTAEAERQQRLREQEEAASVHPSHVPGGIPESLPIKLKGYFFSKSELAFFQTLEGALPQGFRVFANVRLNDLFLITAPPHQRQGTYARLRDKHVDFLIVALPDFRPVCAIELDGATHDQPQQQYRDAVKDVAFRSAGLPLLRLRAEGNHTRQSVQKLLEGYVRQRTVA